MFYWNYFLSVHLTTGLLKWYLVGFLICVGISGMIKKNWLEKLVSPVNRSALLLASTLQNFARWHFVDVNEVFIVFSWEIDIKTGKNFEKFENFNYKSFIKSITKTLSKDLKRLIVVYKNYMKGL